MNATLQKLCLLSQKPERTILGLMSGTSLDGLDIALCHVAGSGLHTKVKLGHFMTINYPEEIKDLIRRVFARKTVELELLTILNAHIARVHSQYIQDALEKWQMSAQDVDLIASHGQTIYHAPKRQHLHPNFPNATLQIGDGDHLAVLTGIITISDFRQKHIAAGGEGAPLALYGDVLLFTHTMEHRVMINLGGIANFTFLPPHGSFVPYLVTDSGPGNTLLDAAMRRYYGRPYDEGGKIARSGQVDSALLTCLLAHPYFADSVPKTTGPEVFNLDYLDHCLVQVPHAIPSQNIIATLTRLTAVSLTDCIKKEITGWPSAAYFTSGGGAENPHLMSEIRGLLPGCRVEDSMVLGVPAGAKEAVLFAVLANETVAGGEIDFRPYPSACTGKISLP